MNYEDKFESYMQTEKGAAKSTLSAYISDIREFTDFLAERGKQPEKANKADAAAFAQAGCGGHGRADHVDDRQRIVGGQVFRCRAGG